MTTDKKAKKLVSNSKTTHRGPSNKNIQSTAIRSDPVAGRSGLVSPIKGMDGGGLK